MSAKGGNPESMLSKAGEHVGSSIIKHIIAFGFWLLGAAMALFLLISAVIPLFASFMGKGKQYVEHLRGVEAFERTHAVYASYSFGILPEAWTYTWARHQIDPLIPESKGAEFNSADESARQEADAHAKLEQSKGDTKAQVQGERSQAAQQAMFAKISGWVDDQMWPIQRAFWIVFLTRATYAAMMFLMFLFVFAGCWFIGEYLARMRVLTGHQPMAHRHRFYLWGLNTGIVGVPTWCACTILPGPTSIIFFLLCTFAAGMIVMTRKHYVEI